jgi:hypothetical protein
MLDAGGEEQVLDVVAVDVVGPAAQGAESVLRTGEFAGEHRVGGCPALRPQLIGLAGLLALGASQFDRDRAGDRPSPDPVVVLVI